MSLSVCLMAITSTLLSLTQAERFATIDVPNDPAARYDVLMLAPIGGRKLEIVTRRVGRRGETFVQREIHCDTQRARLLGQGHTIAQMNMDDHNYRLAPIDPESISGHIADYACAAVDWPG